MRDQPHAHIRCQQIAFSDRLPRAANFADVGLEAHCHTEATGDMFELGYVA